MFGLTLTETLVIILGILTIVKFVTEISTSIRTPNINQDAQLQALTLQLQNFMKTQENANEEMRLQVATIKDNHLSHLQTDITELSKDIAGVRTSVAENTTTLKFILSDYETRLKNDKLKH